MLKTLFIFTIGACGTLIVSAQKYKTLLSEDFGTPGTPISTNPAGQIAPGTTDYSPRTISPVNDGQYAVLTSPRLVSTTAWQDAGDHTTGKGYMMLINANPGKKGESLGSYYLYTTSNLNIPGATYRINFWGANVLSFNTASFPSGNGTGGTFKEAYIGVSVRDNANGTGTQYNATVNGQPQVTTWILPRATGNANNVSWQNLTSAFTLPAAATPAQLMFNFYNSDNTGNNITNGNDLAIDDLLIEMQAVNLSGTIFTDRNANGIIDGGETGINGTTTPLYVYITDNTGKIIAKAPVDANGNYFFDTEVPYATGDIGLKATLSTQNLNIGDPGPAGATAPSGSAIASENGSGNPAIQTGIPDGIIHFTNTATDISGLNIGLQQIPVANPVSYLLNYQPKAGTPIPLNGPVGGANTGATPTAPNGSDAEDGNLGGSTANSTFKLITTPANGTLMYDFGAGPVVIAEGTEIPNFNASRLSIVPNVNGSTSVSFQYAFKDKAGAQSLPAPYSVTWAQPLPVVFGTINARIQNGILQVSWESLSETDNSHFEIEASADGQHFVKIGEVKSNISSGNTPGNTSYAFTMPVHAMALGSIGIAAMGLLGAGFKRRNRNLWILAAIAVTTLYACNKKESLGAPESGKLYIRIGQVDKDGTKTYSKVFQAVHE
ncbi:MAG: hypothetical protein J7599_17195 [Niabella sp.]|nr:hypothetical protein [Niabella sp.]